MNVRAFILKFLNTVSLLNEGIGGKNYNSFNRKSLFLGILLKTNRIIHTHWEGRGGFPLPQPLKSRKT